MYELFIGNKNYSSWSLRPWVLMKAHGIDFVEHVMPFQPGSNWQAFRAFSPSGKVPCLRDGNTVAWDSLGIAGYLAERHPGLWPEDSAARTWARCATAEMHSGFAALRNQCGMNVALRVRLHEWPDALMADVRRLDELWNEGLSRFGGPFLAGRSFTIVDAFFCPVAYRVRTYEIPLTGAARDYAQRLLQLPAMRAWEAEALAEPWRDPPHEDEIAALGDIVADLRVAPGA
ncbi:MAG TPA: glutathione S-transferase family protein [Steroidobacteraceae bacterium]